MSRLSVPALARPLLALLLGVGSVLTFGSATSAVAADTTYPTLGLSPVGANDWGCRPTASRPHPAVIVHGTFGDQQSLLDVLSASLKLNGHCVFSLDYGNRATGPIEDSAAQLQRFVDRVLAATGARKVQIVGHSQGGMMPRYYIKNLGGAGKVEDLVGLAPSNHGTTVTGSSTAWGFDSSQGCYSCGQQAADSAFLTALNADDETPGPVHYTQVVTRYDEVVVPYTSGFLTPGRNSTNIVVQESCALDLTEHVLIPSDRVAIAWTLNAFNREGPADAAAPIGCA